MISIIIPSRNTKDLLLGCLAAIDDNPPDYDYEIIITDNDSSDGSVQAIYEKHPQVTVLQSQKNLGFSRACNMGAGKAAGGFLLFLNSDTLVLPKSIDLLASALEASPNAGIVAPRLLDRNGNDDQSVVSYIRSPIAVLFSAARKRAKARLAKLMADGDDISGQAYFCGAAIMVRRDAFEAIGGFDESFFFYSEDEDLCRRLANIGWRLLLVPEARIIHLSGLSSKLVRIGAEIEVERSRLLYIRKHYGFAYAALTGLGLFLGRIRRTLSNTLGVVLTIGLNRRLRIGTVESAAVCLWFLCGMPTGNTWCYRTVFCDWQTRRKPLLD
ncbi:MAG: glycosyltransferase family 2 protein [Armatimonadota bacterium]|nr:glycosyltransferase family 2 protein [Armatimonadota bacterium]